MVSTFMTSNTLRYNKQKLSDASHRSFGRYVATRQLMQLRILLISALLIIYSNAAIATADAETPEQEIEILRMLLLHQEMHVALADMKQAGCEWQSEFIWFGAPEKISEHKYRWGGELVIQFELKYSPETSLRISFAGMHTKEKRTIDSVVVEATLDLADRCI